jgi:hypothetical protein
MDDRRARIIAREEFAAVAAFMLGRMHEAAKASGTPLAAELAAFLEEVLRPACSGWPPNDGSPRSPRRVADG